MLWGNRRKCGSIIDGRRCRDPKILPEQRSNLIQNFRPSPDSIESSHRSSWYHMGFRQPRVITEMVASGAPALIAIIFRRFTSYFSAVVHDIRPMEEN